MKKKFIAMIVTILVAANLFVINADAKERNYTLSSKESVQDYFEMINKYKNSVGTKYTLNNEEEIKVTYTVKEGIVPISAWEGNKALIFEVIDKIGKPIEEVTYSDIAEIKMLQFSGVSGLGPNGEIIERPVFEGELPEILKEFKTLRIIDLSSTTITKIPDWFYSLTELREVNLSSTDISEISPNIKNLKELNVLNLMWSKVASLPTEISTLEKLEAINIATIPFIENKQIPKEVFNIKNLKDLEFPFGGLTELPEDIKKLTKLEYVNLAMNKLDKFPKELYELKNLQIVILYSNSIKSVDERISDLSNLNLLVLGNNKLTKLPESLKNIKGDLNLFIDASFNYLYNEQILGDRQRIDLCGNFIDCPIEHKLGLEEFGIKQDKIYRQLGLKSNVIEVNPGEEITSDKIKGLVNAIFIEIIGDEKIVGVTTQLDEADLKFELLDSNGKILELKDTKYLPVGSNKLKVKLVGSAINNEKAMSDLTIDVKRVNEGSDGEKPGEKPVVPDTTQPSPSTNKVSTQNVDVSRLPNTGGSNPMVQLLLGLLSTSGGVTLFRRRK